MEESRVLEMTNCIAVGVTDRAAAAESFRRLGFSTGKEGADWIEVLAGPLRLFFVEDGTKDMAFAFESADLAASRAALEAEGFFLDREVTDRVGELFFRDPNGHLFNLSPKEGS